MKDKINFLMIFFFVISMQSQTTNTFLIELSGSNKTLKLKKQNGIMVYDGIDKKEKEFFAKNRILDFYQSFPDSKQARTLNIYTLVTYDKNIMSDLEKNFKDKYIGHKDVSNLKIKLGYNYPDDYGTTSPVPNLGIAASMKSFDYINVPKAWSYTEGLSSVKIGISDSKINTDDDDFKFKTTLLPGYSPYTNTPYSLQSDENWHGSSTAAIAAAQGNNSHGTVGVCSNCSILATKYDYGSPGSEQNPTPALNRLLQLAYAGAKVINMSWGWYSTDGVNYDYYKWVIDEIYNLGVTLVAASMNISSFKPEYASNNYMLYAYPASYDNVISVSGVNHKNKFGVEGVINIPVYGDVSRFAEDMIAPSVVINYNGNGPYSFSDSTLTTNDKVDICAPAYQIPQYPWFDLGGMPEKDVNGNLTGNLLFYGTGTSGAAPAVSGTIGLMYSLNQCLINYEINDILQLTSKNLEHIPGNEPFIGRSGSGKLETGNAIEFVYEMNSNIGNAKIDGQDFYRFDFKLEHVNNKLTISNQIFRDLCKADFTARNSIEILQNTDLKPTNGFVDLKTNTGMAITCGGNPQYREAKNEWEIVNQKFSTTKLYPNPNNGLFSVILDNQHSKDVLVNVYDVLGKNVYNSKINETNFDIIIPNLPSGLYFVKLISDSYSETLKFIKN